MTRPCTHTAFWNCLAWQLSSPGAATCFVFASCIRHDAPFAVKHVLTKHLVQMVRPPQDAALLQEHGDNELRWQQAIRSPACCISYHHRCRRLAPTLFDCCCNPRLLRLVLLGWGTGDGVLSRPHSSWLGRSGGDQVVLPRDGLPAVHHHAVAHVGQRRGDADDEGPCAPDTNPSSQLHSLSCNTVVWPSRAQAELRATCGAMLSANPEGSWGNSALPLMVAQVVMCWRWPQDWALLTRRLQLSHGAQSPATGH